MSNSVASSVSTYSCRSAGWLKADWKKLILAEWLCCSWLNSLKCLAVSWLIEAGLRRAVRPCSTSFSAWLSGASWLAGACNNRATREKASQARDFQAFGHSTFASIPLAKVSHIVKPKTKGREICSPRMITKPHGKGWRIGPLIQATRFRPPFRNRKLHSRFPYTFTPVGLRKRPVSWGMQNLGLSSLGPIFPANHISVLLKVWLKGWQNQ